jgi:hypothetical protein
MEQLSRRAIADNLAMDLRIELEACGLALADDLVLKIDCALARRDYARDPRVHAHVDSIEPYGTVCIVAELLELPRANQLGVMWHEVGHILADQYEVTPTAAELADAERIYPDRPPDERLDEARANAAARELCGRPISYGPDLLQRTH